MKQKKRNSIICPLIPMDPNLPKDFYARKPSSEHHSEWAPSVPATEEEFENPPTSGVTTLNETCVKASPTKIINPISFLAKAIDLDTGKLEEIQLPDELSTYRGAVFVKGSKQDDALSIFANGLAALGEEAPYAHKRIYNKLAEANPDIVRPTALNSAATNFSIKPVKIVEKVGRDGHELESQSTVVCKLEINTKKGYVLHTFEHLKKDISTLVSSVTKRYPEAIIYDRNAYTEIEICFREELPLTDVELNYVEAGWNRMPDGQMVYISKESLIPGSTVSTEFSLPSMPSVQKNDLLDIFSDVINIHRQKEVGAALFYFSLTGVLYRLFAEAGADYRVQFLAFLNGTTGTRKTSVAKILFSQLEQPEYRDRPRRVDADTKTAQERALALNGVDRITLFDDFAPPKTVSDRNETASKLEQLIRMAGDGSTKSRSNGKLEERRGEGVQGTIAVTGELLGKGRSSLLRCLLLPFEPGDINLVLLNKFQRSRDLFTTYIRHFANFVGSNYLNILQMIRKEFPAYRDLIKNDAVEPRQIDMFATLSVIAEINAFFLVEYCGENPEKTKGIIQETIPCMRLLIARNSQIANSENPTIVFLDTLSDLLGKKALKISNGVCNLNSSEAGFLENEFLFLDVDVTYNAVINAIRMRGGEFPLDQKNVGLLLCQEGFAFYAKNGGSRKNYYFRRKVGDRTLKFFKVKKSLFPAIDA